MRYGLGLSNDTANAFVEHCVKSGQRSDRNLKMKFNVNSLKASNFARNFLYKSQCSRNVKCRK